MNPETLIRNVLERAVEQKNTWQNDGRSSASHGAEWEEAHKALACLPADPTRVLAQTRDGGPPIGVSDWDIPWHAIACYFPCFDQIKYRKELKGYRLAQSIAHELCHATGHPSRLNRVVPRLIIARRFNTWRYEREAAVEELIAELGSLVVLLGLGYQVQLLAPIMYCAGSLKQIPRLHRDVVIREALAAAEFVLRGEWS
jgi:hypothetical protein